MVQKSTFCMIIIHMNSLFLKMRYSINNVSLLKITLNQKMALLIVHKVYMGHYVDVLPSSTFGYNQICMLNPHLSPCPTFIHSRFLSPNFAPSNSILINSRNN